MTQARGQDETHINEGLTTHLRRKEHSSVALNSDRVLICHCLTWLRACGENIVHSPIDTVHVPKLFRQSPVCIWEVDTFYQCL